jgi:hypothetical protein
VDFLFVDRWIVIVGSTHRIFAKVASLVIELDCLHLIRCKELPLIEESLIGRLLPLNIGKSCLYIYMNSRFPALLSWYLLNHQPRRRSSSSIQDISTMFRCLKSQLHGILQNFSEAEVHYLCGTVAAQLWMYGKYTTSKTLLHNLYADLPLALW